jgi:hypothetical protein
VKTMPFLTCKMPGPMQITLHRVKVGMECVMGLREYGRPKQNCSKKRKKKSQAVKATLLIWTRESQPSKVAVQAKVKSTFPCSNHLAPPCSSNRLTTGIQGSENWWILGTPAQIFPPHRTTLEDLWHWLN